VYEITCAPPVPPVVAKRYSVQTQWKAAKADHVLGLLAAAGVGPLPRILHRGPDFLLQSRVERTMLSALLPELEPAQVRDVYRELGRVLATIHRIRNRPSATW
jgi:hygromycin-B 7''-O-kinase